MEEKDLQNKKENYTGKIFKLAGEIAFIFAVPVFIAAVIGTRLDTRHASGHKFTLISLAVAFVFSWVLFIRKYFKIIKQK